MASATLPADKSEIADNVGSESCNKLQSYGYYYDLSAFDIAQGESPMASATVLTSFRA